MNANHPDGGDRRGNHAALRRSAALHAQASALIAIAHKIVHDARNSKREAQLLRHVRNR